MIFRLRRRLGNAARARWLARAELVKVCREPIRELRCGDRIDLIPRRRLFPAAVAPRIAAGEADPAAVGEARVPDRADRPVAPAREAIGSGVS